MKTIEPQQFLEQLTDNKIFTPRDHHFTGPVERQQPEGHGSIWHIEGMILANLAKLLGGDVLEVGTQNAISTRYISEGLEAQDHQRMSRTTKHPVVHTVDCNQRWINNDNWPNIVAHKCYSFQFEPRPCAWAFIDGDHSFGGVIQDIILAEKCDCEVMVFHDCHERLLKHDPPSEAGLAVPHYFKEKDWELTYISTLAGLVVAEAL